MSDETMTVSGRRIHLLDFKPTDLDIEDIAHHLSMTCRFGGAVERWYSNAQHSLLVSDLCGFLPTAVDVERLARLAGLLHDAPEAYIQDLARPTKNAVAALSMSGSAYEILHTMIAKRVEDEFDLGDGALTDSEHPICATIEMADRHALILEDFVLRPHAQVNLNEMLTKLRQAPSPLFHNYADACEMLARKLDSNILPQPEAKAAFLARYFELVEVTP